MSQATLSRVENAPDPKVLYRIGIAAIDLFLDGYATPPSHGVRDIDDIDDIDDLVHGGQRLARFNTHAGGHGVQPIHIFEANSGKPPLSRLREGKRPSGREIARVPWHVIHRVRQRSPKVGILVRGDGHSCAPEVHDLLRRLDCDDILGLPRNTTLDARAEPWKRVCNWRRKSACPKVRRFHRFQYAAGPWSHEEKVIARVEATALGTDARVIVTSLAGRMENLIKHLKLDTRSDKTARHRWEANQFRLFSHQAAYWLLHSVRCAALERSRWRGATFATVLTMFIKIACSVDELRRSIKLSFAEALPQADVLSPMTARLTARGS